MVSGRLVLMGRAVVRVGLNAGIAVPDDLAVLLALTLELTWFMSR